MDISNETFFEDERKIKKSGVRQIFTPSTPVKDENLFKGRKSELRQILQTINTPGQHALLFGDRGVGKSSLANVVSKFLLEDGSYTLINKRCDSRDTFRSIIEEVVQKSGIDTTIESTTNTKKGDAKILIASGEIGKSVTRSGQEKYIDSPSWVCNQIKDLNALLIIDEFDSISSKDEKTKIAELIKQLSDSNSNLKVIIVGVADTSAELTAGHKSVQRCLTEVKLNKMTRDELIQIIKDGASKLGLTFEKEAMIRIARVSSGYPYFTHLLALRASEEAIIKEIKTITLEDIKLATEKALSDCENSLKQIYNTATSYNNNMCKKILYAAALCNEEFVRASDLRLKYKEIFNEDIKQNTINSYLPQLVGPTDKIMKRLSKGVYRFADPRMVSYIRIAQYDMEDLKSKEGL